MPIQVHT